MYLKSVQKTSATFEEGFNKATIKIKDGEVMDKAIECLGSYVKIWIEDGYITRIQDNEEAWFEEQKENE